MLGAPRRLHRFAHRATWLLTIINALFLLLFALAFVIPLPTRDAGWSVVIEYRDGQPAHVFLSPDDKWRLLALTTFEGATGEYQAQITYEGEIGVVINNEPVSISPAKGKGTILLAITKEEGKPLPIRLSLADTGGPAVLKWQLIKR